MRKPHTRWANSYAQNQLGMSIRYWGHQRFLQSFPSSHPGRPLSLKGNAPQLLQSFSASSYTLPHCCPGQEQQPPPPQGKLSSSLAPLASVPLTSTPHPPTHPQHYPANENGSDRAGLPIWRGPSDCVYFQTWPYLAVCVHH